MDSGAETTQCKKAPQSNPNRDLASTTVASTAVALIVICTVIALARPGWRWLLVVPALLIMVPILMQSRATARAGLRVFEWLMLPLLLVILPIEFRRTLRFRCDCPIEELGEVPASMDESNRARFEELRRELERQGFILESRHEYSEFLNPSGPDRNYRETLVHPTDRTECVVILTLSTLPADLFRPKVVFSTRYAPELGLETTHSFARMWMPRISTCRQLGVKPGLSVEAMYAVHRQFVAAQGKGLPMCIAPSENRVARIRKDMDQFVEHLVEHGILVPAEEPGCFRLTPKGAFRFGWQELEFVRIVRTWFWRRADARNARRWGIAC